MERNVAHSFQLHLVKRRDLDLKKTSQDVKSYDESLMYMILCDKTSFDVFLSHLNPLRSPHSGAISKCIIHAIP